MSLTSRPYRLLAVAAALVLAVSCSGDSILGPPDGANCTRGTIEIGEVHEGEVDADDCVLWHDYEEFSAPAESWTLHAKANTAYIVRMDPIPDGNAVDNLNGEPVLYARNSAGDPVYATGWWGQYGAANPNGGTAKEMIFTVAQDQTVSVRVQAYEEADVGAYNLVVLSCPVATLASGATSAPIVFDFDCTVLTGGALAETPIAFLNFAANAGDGFTVTTTRTAGTSNMMTRVGGPDLDYGCYTGDCTFVQSATGAGPHAVPGTILVSGFFTVAVYQQTAGTLTTTVGLTVVPAP